MTVTATSTSTTTERKFANDRNASSSENLVRHKLGIHCSPLARMLSGNLVDFQIQFLTKGAAQSALREAMPV